MKYPPFGDIIVVNFTADSEELAAGAAARCEAYMKNALQATYGSESEKNVLSPKLSTGFKGKNSFRHYIIVKCPRSEQGHGASERNRYMYYLEDFARRLVDEKAPVNITVDVNPYSLT